VYFTAQDKIVGDDKIIVNIDETSRSLLKV